MKKKVINTYKLLAVVAIFFLLIGCKNTNQYPSFEDSVLTPSNGVFSDLGNYTILLDEYKEAPDFDEVVTYYQNIEGILGGCTACAKQNSKGEVLIGRNLDMEISLNPMFIIPTSFGKYKTIQFRYITQEIYDYEDFKNDGYKNTKFINALPYYCTDGLNEKGLYIEANMREANEDWQSTGTNPGKKRVRTDVVVSELLRNCSTVEEAVSYLQNELDVYSYDYVNNETPTDYAWLMGDATGEYGVVELAFNKIVYLPHQNAHANFYINPDWNKKDLWGSGYGRYEMVLEGLKEIETQEEMFNHMDKVKWRDMTLYAEYSYIDENGIPHFVNDKGEKVVDWRSDFYFSMLYKIWPKEKVDEFVKDKNQKWMIDDKNAEEVFYYFKDYYIKTGGKNDLLEYYKGNEIPLRTKISAATTGAQFSINCSTKNIIVRFFENDDSMYQFSFK